MGARRIFRCAFSAIFWRIQTEASGALWESSLDLGDGPPSSPSIEPALAFGSGSSASQEYGSQGGAVSLDGTSGLAPENGASGCEMTEFAAETETIVRLMADHLVGVPPRCA
ncbi:phytoene dehydrogenase-like oxidoreductase [Methylobacterium sp. ME121]|nr:phytoene dehydrogenase-like oxidoreductase [Methylobacterium sp. ME121]